MKIPESFAALQGMGRVIDVYPLRQRFWARWGPLLLALAAGAGGAAVLLYGLYATYLKYYKFGPAVVGKTLTLPVAIAGGLALIAVLAGASAYANWPKSAAFFEQGFAYRDRRGVHAWRWEEIASLRAEVVRHTALGMDTGVTHRYTFTRRDGRRLALDDELERVELLARNIHERVVPRLYDQCAGAFNLGQDIDFERFSMSKAGGIKWGKNVPVEPGRRGDPSPGSLAHLTRGGERPLQRNPGAGLQDP